MANFGQKFFEPTCVPALLFLLWQTTRTEWVDLCAVAAKKSFARCWKRTSMVVFSKSVSRHLSWENKSAIPSFKRRAFFHPMAAIHYTSNSRCGVTVRKRRFGFLHGVLQRSQVTCHWDYGPISVHLESPRGSWKHTSKWQDIGWPNQICPFC